MLKKLGSVKIPSSVRSQVLKLARLSNYRKHIAAWDVHQLDTHRIKNTGAIGVQYWESIWSHLQPLLPVFGTSFRGQEHSLLYFRSVEEHTDEWPNLLLGGRRYRPVFFHIVLAGRAVVKTGKSSLAIETGDVFVIDMNKPHEVTSGSLCATACLTYPKIAFT